jgi:hypothetical protein
MEKESKKMRGFIFPLLIFVTFLSLLIMCTPADAVTDRAVLEIQGMT